MLDKRIIRLRFPVTRFDAELGEAGDIERNREEESDCLYSHIHRFIGLFILSSVLFDNPVDAKAKKLRFQSFKDELHVVLTV